MQRTDILRKGDPVSVIRDKGVLEKVLFKAVNITAIL